MKAINIIFDSEPGPSPESGRFVEVETDNGKSINIGKWIELDDGFYALRITEEEFNNFFNNKKEEENNENIIDKSTSRI